MSEGTKAVFLSYASQDSEAAKRIAEALRAAGVEVWFDQAELVGGDAWDAKIRKQIAECALFVPIISANTQARLEGYFRLEWKIAAQRTHTMADERVFLLPVVLDDTRDAEAKVPSEFKGVQWTRLPGGEKTGAFCARVVKLLTAGASEEPASARGASAAPAADTSRRKSAWIGYGWAAVGILFALVYAVRPMFQEPRPKPAQPAVEPAPVSEARRLTQQARELLIKPGRGSSKWEAAALLCERALALDPTDAEALALASQVDSRLWFHVFDRTPKRSESARIRAARALDLAPTSFESRLAQATFLVLVAGRPQSEQAESVLRQLRLEAPTDRRPVNLLGSLMVALQRNEEALAFADELARLPGNESEGLVQRSWNLHWLRRIPEMETALDRSIELRPIAGSVTLRVYYDLGWWGEGDRALASLNRLPAEELAEDNGISAAVRVHRWRRDPEALLRFLGTVPRDWIWWGIRGPKAALTGDAHAAAGRMIAARTDWQGALALVERRLIEAPNDQNLLEWKAYLHARLGDAAAARDAYQRSLESMPIERSSLEIEKLAYIAPEDVVLTELEQQAASTVADLEAKRRMSARFISAADLRLNPAWDPVRPLPRFQALQVKLDADPRFNPKAAPARDDSSFAKATEDWSGKASAVAQPMADKSPPDQKSVAVLAFANLSDDKANEYFSDGISEELLNVLARVPGLKVSARTSAFHFKGKDTAISEIAKQLGVAYVVEGSVRKAGDKVRITAQLIKAADGFHVWSDTFTRDLKDIFAVQDEIAGLIARNLSLRLGADRSATARATVPEAFELYVRGRAAWNLRTREGYAQAESLLTRAIELDPGFARAHSALADVWMIASYEDDSGGGTYGWRNSPTVEKIAAKAEQALALDPLCAESHTSLASALEFGWKWEEAERVYQRAIELNPNYATARHWFGMLLLTQGKMDEALRQLKQAAESDPLSHRILDTYASMLNKAGRPAEALAVAEQALALQPLAIQAATQKARAMVLLGRANEAVALLEKAVTPSANIDQRTNALHVLHHAGGDAAVRQLIGATEVLPSSQFKVASLIALGRSGEALAELRPAELHQSQLSNLAFLSFYDPIREDPRFLQAITDVGYLEHYRRARAWLAANPAKGKK